MVRRFADFALAGEEDEDVARIGAAPEFVHRIGDRVIEVVLARFDKGPPALLHREQPSRHLNHRRGPTR